MSDLRSLIAASAAHPWRVIAGVALVALGLAVAIPAIELRLDGRSLLPARHPRLAASDEAGKRFHLRDVVVLGVFAGEGGVFQPEVLERVRRLSGELAAMPGVVPSSVASLATLPRLFIEGDTLDADPLLSRPGPVTPALAAQLARETEALGLADGVLVARDGRATAVYAEVGAEADRALLLEAARTALAREGAAGGDVALSGTALAQAVLGLGAARDLVRLVPAVILVLGLSLVLLFRHPLPALVSLAEIGASLLITAGTMGLAGESVFVTTLVLPVILIVIGVSDDVYALHHFFRHRAEHPEEPVATAVVASFGAVARPILLTALTTIAGLLALLATPLEPQRVFGLYGALAIFLSTLMTFTLVPALLVLLAPRWRVAAGGEGEGGRGERWAGAFLDGLERWGPRRLLVALAVVTLAAAWACRGLAVEDNWVRNLPPGGDIAQGDRRLNERMAGTTRVELMVGSRHPEGFLAPEELAALGRFQDALAGVEHVGAVESVLDDVLRVEAALAGRPWAALRADVLAGRSALDAVAIERSLLLLGSLRHSPLAERIEEGNRRARLTVYVNRSSYARIGRLLAAARAGAGAFEVTPFGDGWVSYQAVDLLVVGQVLSVATALLANALLLLLLLRSLPATLLALAPIASAVTGVFAVLALSGTPLGIANSMFAAIALGIGIDYSIHLVADYQAVARSGQPRGEALRRAFSATAPAIVKSAVAISVGLAVLGFSAVLPNYQLGLLVCLSLGLCALATLLVVPLVILSKRVRGAG
ncbi:MAG TPA: MMPL family transporter [Thermoanaerobaculia bacterium]|nr:MMPL family transporter [Thermoanaerobaculia bacterium]